MLISEQESSETKTNTVPSDIRCSFRDDGDYQPIFFNEEYEPFFTSDDEDEVVESVKVSQKSPSVKPSTLPAKSARGPPQKSSNINSGGTAKPAATPVKSTTVPQNATPAPKTSAATTAATTSPATKTSTTASSSQPKSSGGSYSSPFVFPTSQPSTSTAKASTPSGPRPAAPASSTTNPAPQKPPSTSSAKPAASSSKPSAPKHSQPHGYPYSAEQIWGMPFAEMSDLEQDQVSSMFKDMMIKSITECGAVSVIHRRKDGTIHMMHGEFGSG